jgi:hypothetical protein
MAGWKDALVGFAGGVGQGLMFNQMKGMFGDTPPAPQGQSDPWVVERPHQLSPQAATCIQFGGTPSPDGRCILPNGEEILTGINNKAAPGADPGVRRPQPRPWAGEM